MTRKWFQIHLSTAVVLMFVAALLGYLNIIGWFGHVDVWITKSEHLTGVSLGFPIKPAARGPQTMTRKWFQIHLSTVLILILAVGTLMLLNFEPDSEQSLINTRYDIASRVDNWMILPAFYSYDDAEYVSGVKNYGWPLVFVYDGEWPPIKILKGGLIVNCAVWSFILLTIAISCELSIRRETRKR